MSILSEIINSDPKFAGPMDKQTSDSHAPVTATPAIAVVAAKVAGGVIGGGAVCGAAYAAYRTVAR